MQRRLLRVVLDGLHRRPVLEITLAFLAVLVVAQALIGALSLSALYRLNAETTADRAEVEVRQMAAGIENGLRLGKPLAQFFGLGELLDQRLAASRDARGGVVMLADGQVVVARGQALPESGVLARVMSNPTASLPEGLALRPKGAVVAISKHQITVAVPLTVAGSPAQGLAVLAVTRDAVGARRFILHNLAVLFGVTLVAGLALAAYFKYFVPPARLASGGRTRFLLPLVTLILAQGLYAAYTIHTFREASLQVTRDNVQMLAQGLQRDLDRVLKFGIAIDHLREVEAPLSRLAATFPIIRSIELVDMSGRVLNRADARGALTVDQTASAAGEFIVSLPLGAGTHGGGQLIMRLADDVVAASVRARVIDALTVVAVALVVAFEMILLLTLLLRWPRHGNSDGAEIGRIGRPVMFGFLFAWALPLSFLPLYARSLPNSGLALPPNLLLALPISVEMGCGLLTALLAGGLTDRRGWQVPVLVGLAVSGLGFAACAMAPDLIWFTAARGLVGLGYGLTWMGLQGFIVTRSAPAFRGVNVSNVVAGLFAGHLAGAAVGAMLMEQLGFRAVFTVGVAMLLVPLAGVLVLMRSFMVTPAFVAAMATRARPPRASLASMMRLLFTRAFGLLLLGSVIPFSIAQVGLLSFALPLYLEAEGAAASSIGRVLMIYGLCVIYLGPVMGRLADRSRAKKRWIVAGGLIGSLGLLSLYFNSGMLAASLAVLSLAMASCLAGSSQASYMLALPDVQRYGAAGATSLMRAADKLGQMGGPLVVGMMFGTVGMGAGLAVTGLIYLMATLIFLLCAPVTPPATPAHGPSNR